MNETPSPTGAKRCLAWMKACEEMGWPKSAMPALVDIFWKYKDRDGNLKDERPAQETFVGCCDCPTPVTCHEKRQCDSGRASVNRGEG